jgi:hypothetical protein
MGRLLAKAAFLTADLILADAPNPCGSEPAREGGLALTIDVD